MVLNQSHLWWIVINLIVPVFAPIAICMGLRAGTHGVNRDKLAPMMLVKDGQLGWIAAALCAAAIYEACDISSDYATVRLIAIVTLGALGFFSALFSVQGITNPVPFPLEQSDDWRPFRATFATTWLSAVIFLLVHFRADYLHLLHDLV